MNQFKRFIFLTSVFLWTSPVIAQFRQPQLTRIDKSKGIESNFVSDITIDKEFKYWIASSNGVISYDGSKFKTYHLPLVQRNIPGSDILFNIKFANDSILWVTHIQGIAQFNIHTCQFTLIPVAGYTNTATFEFRPTFVDKKGNSFFCTVQSKLLHYNPKKGCVEDYEPLKDKGTDFVMNMSEVPGGYYLLQTREGLKLFDPLKEIIIPEGETPSEYSWIYLKQFDGFVNDYEEIGVFRFVSVLNAEKDYHVYKYNTNTGSLDTIPIVSKAGRLLTKDSFGHLWLYGFRDQLELYDIKTNKVYVLPDKTTNTPDIDFYLCNQVFEDHEHNIWICTTKGLFTYNLFQNTIELLSKELPKNYWTEVREISPGILWLGTMDKGIYELNTNKGTFTNNDFYAQTKDHFFKEVEQILVQKHFNRIWITSYMGRLVKYDRTHKHFDFYKDSLFVDTDICIDEDEKGHVFIGSSNGKILAYNETTETFREIVNLNKLKGLTKKVSINTLKHINGDWFCAGTFETGLIKINLNTLQYQLFQIDSKNSNSLKSNYITTLEKFDEDRIFGGTFNGVFCYNFKTNKIESFDYNDNVSLGYVWKIAIDNRKNLIIIDINGLHLLNWETKNIVDLGKRSNIERSILTGLCFSKTSDKVFVTAENDIFSIYLNPHISKPAFKPIIYYVVSFDKTYTIAGKKEIVIDKNHSSFAINFGASSYIYRGDLEYYYKLSNSDWIPATSNEISFIKLPGGTYHFKLKVVYKGDRKISAEADLKITIEKAFYETTWFYLLIIISTLAVIYLIYRSRISHLLAIEKVRFQLSRDLHDDMGSILSTINILSSIAGHKIDKDPATAKNYIDRISSNSQQMMESMDDIVWSINPANDDMNKVIYRMREFAWSILEPKKISLIFNYKEDLTDLKLSMAHRRDFFLIYKEAINNAAKYSECTKVKVSLYAENKHLVLEIKDNGKGFNIHEVENGNGLVNMKKRAASLKSEFDITSELNLGTTIQIKMKLLAL